MQIKNGNNNKKVKKKNDLKQTKMSKVENKSFKLKTLIYDSNFVHTKKVICM